MITLVRIIFVTLFAVLIGFVASFASIGFVKSIDLLNDLLLISARSRVLAGDSIWVTLLTICVPAIGGLLVGLLWRMIPERRPLGPPDAILSVQTLSGQLPTRSGLITAAGGIVSLGCGASVGQYGPLVHLGSTLGAALGAALGTCVSALTARLTGISVQDIGKDKHTLGIIGIGCGAAAAIATAFNAPIAGLIFAHEVILRHYSIRAFAPVTVAASIGYFVANFVFKQTPFFRINAVTLQQPTELIGFVLIGIFGALLAVVFMRAILASAKVAKSSSLPGPLKPMLAGLIVGLVALWQPEIQGMGREVLRFATIDGAFELNELALLIFLKIGLTALCIGFGFAGGVFSPALLIGILFGALAGGFAEIIWTDTRSAIAIYAICGMVAVTSPVIGAPLTTILIVFELTGNYDLALACMISVVFANLVGYRIFGRSLFDIQLASRGVDLSQGREKAILDNRALASYVSTAYTLVDSDRTLAYVQEQLIADNRSEAYIVDNRGSYCGTITLNQLINWERNSVHARKVAGSHAQAEPLIFKVDTTVWQAMKLLEDFVGESIPVVNDSNQLVGVIFEATLVKAYFDTLNAIRDEEYAPL